MEQLRCKTPEMARKELWVYLLATVSASYLPVGGKAGTLAVSAGPSAASGDRSGFSGRAMSVGA